MRTHSVRRFGAAATALVVGVASAACDPVPPPPLPVVHNVSAALPYVFHPDGAPAGANDPTCKSTKHPTPVILVPATVATMGENYATLSPLLKNNGYCVFSFNYGKTGFTDATFCNITLQDKCILDQADHLAIAFDHIALRRVSGLSPDSACR